MTFLLKIWPKRSYKSQLWLYVLNMELYIYPITTYFNTIYWLFNSLYSVLRVFSLSIYWGTLILTYQNVCFSQILKYIYIFILTNFNKTYLKRYFLHTHIYIYIYIEQRRFPLYKIIILFVYVITLHK